jgi:hypothetical protein
MVVLQNFETFMKPTVRTGIGSEFTGKRYDGHATEFSVAVERDMLMSRSAQAIGEHMTKRVPSQPGDVLILLTEHSFTIYAVGRVSKEGQQDFHSEEDVKYETDRDTAVAAAKALGAPGRRIFLRNLDAGHWSEISS